MAKRSRTLKVPVALPAMESAPERWLRTIRLSGFTLTMLALVVITVVVLAPGLRVLVEQRQQIAALTQTVAEKEQSVEDLETDVARWNDPAYIEAQARDRLVYVFPGDYTYLVIDDGQTVTTDDGAVISDSIQTTSVDWVQSLLGTVFTAGLTDATADDLATPPTTGTQ
jgi:cell division protein FtsB